MRFVAADAIVVRLRREELLGQPATTLPHLHIRRALARRYPAAVIYSHPQVQQIDGVTYMPVYLEVQFQSAGKSWSGLSLDEVWLMRIHEGVNYDIRSN